MPIQSWAELGLLEFTFTKRFTTSACGSSSFEGTPQTLREAVTGIGVDPMTLPQNLIAAIEPSLRPLHGTPSRSKSSWLCTYLCNIRLKRRRCK